MSPQEQDDEPDPPEQLQLSQSSPSSANAIDILRVDSNEMSAVLFKSLNKLTLTYVNAITEKMHNTKKVFFMNLVFKLIFYVIILNK